MRHGARRPRPPGPGAPAGPGGPRAAAAAARAPARPGPGPSPTRSASESQCTAGRQGSRLARSTRPGTPAARPPLSDPPSRTDSDADSEPELAWQSEAGRRGRAQPRHAPGAFRVTGKFHSGPGAQARSLRFSEAGCGLAAVPRPARPGPTRNFKPENFQLEVESDSESDFDFSQPQAEPEAAPRPVAEAQAPEIGWTRTRTGGSTPLQGISDSVSFRAKKKTNYK